jgi:hypothetical protein
LRPRPSQEHGNKRSRSRRLRLAALAAVLTVAAGLLGCGSDDGSDETTGEDTALAEAQQNELEAAGEITTPIDASDVVKTFPPQVVTDGDVGAEKEGTPERAFLEWWQAYQFHDALAVEALTSKATLDAVGSENLKQLVATQSLGGVEILGVTKSGETAEVEAGLLTFQPPAEGEPPPRKPTSSTPQSFAMANEDGDWVFDDTEYLELKVNALSG